MIKLIITASISSFFFGLFGVDWTSVDDKIDKEFPNIDFISSDELFGLYNSTTELPVIIDVRELDDYQVSHLNSALNIQTGAEVANQVPDKEAAIIVYCSVGYRSSGVAADLESLGYTNVRNLRHSLFEWANVGKPMVNSEGNTTMAHPYNKAWGNLLDSELHQYSDFP